MSGKHAFGAAAAAAVITAIAALLATFIIVFGDDDAAMSYRSLDYEVTVQPDGDLEITQHVDLRLNEREDDDDNTVPWKQLYQQYRLDPDNLTAITGVSVTDASTGENLRADRPAHPVRHRRRRVERVVCTALVHRRRHRWRGRPATLYAGRRHRRTTHGGDRLEHPRHRGGRQHALRRHDDVRGRDEPRTTTLPTFQWEPFGPSNQVPIGTVIGTVRLPDGGDGSLSRAWLHFSGTSETSRSNKRAAVHRIRTCAPASISTNRYTYRST